MNGNGDPPVCKIESYFEKVAEARKHSKAAKAKSKPLKGMYITGGIEQRDFNSKFNKILEFLKGGHAVKVTIMPKKFSKGNRFKDGVRRDRMEGIYMLFIIKKCV